MGRSIEIELKFEILDAPQVQAFVQDLSLLGHKRIVDVYLDTPAGVLFKQGIFIRVRDGQKLDIKFNQEDMAKGLDEKPEHTHCDEVSCPLPLNDRSMAQANSTLVQLGLQPMTKPDVKNLM